MLRRGVRGYGWKNEDKARTQSGPSPRKEKAQRPPSWRSHTKGPPADGPNKPAEKSGTAGNTRSREEEGSLLNGTSQLHYTLSEIYWQKQIESGGVGYHQKNIHHAGQHTGSSCERDRSRDMELVSSQKQSGRVEWAECKSLFTSWVGRSEFVKGLQLKLGQSRANTKNVTSGQATMRTFLRPTAVVSADLQRTCRKDSPKKFQENLRCDLAAV
ncbi:hypothetical protein DFH07DRAFT_763949 [Mycena maculata]|uniref:Uncharacterized protein n=1 Tax=Mycena maculata TaxID=230809 RepID=A0AAD7KIF5_9AGAR|nr:hypothetical protein DFH07DRAFT_763949 [Mycena maculata]